MNTEKRRAIEDANYGSAYSIEQKGPIQNMSEEERMYHDNLAQIKAINKNARKFDAKIKQATSTAEGIAKKTQPCNCY